jgi:hypothetical protein
MDFIAASYINVISIRKVVDQVLSRSDDRAT